LKRSRRSRKVSLIVLLIAVALVAAACSSSPAEDAGVETTTTTTAAPDTTTTEAPPETTTTTEPPLQRPYGGEAINGADQEPATLNRFIPGGDNAVVIDLGQLWSSGVQEVDGFTLEFIPEMVTELPTVANGGVTVNDDGTMTVVYQIVADC